MTVIEQIEQFASHPAAFRRDPHALPELGYQGERTSANYDFNDAILPLGANLWFGPVETRSAKN